MIKWQANTLRRSKSAQIVGKQYWNLGGRSAKQILSVFVALPYSPGDARLIKAGVALTCGG